MLNYVPFFLGQQDCSFVGIARLAGGTAVAVVLESQAGGNAQMVNILPSPLPPAFPRKPSVRTPAYDLGPTFCVAVVAFLLAVIEAILLLVFVRYAGDGPFYKCIAANNVNVTTAQISSYNAGVAAQGEWSQPQPPTRVAPPTSSRPEPPRAAPAEPIAATAAATTGSTGATGNGEA